MRALEKMPMPATDQRGMRFRATRRQSGWPGTARSREKANIILEADVTDAVRQKNCATTQMKRSASAQFWLMDSAQIHGTTAPMFSSAPSVLGMANVTARRRIQPKMTEATTAVHMPVAAIREALFVSSAVWAEASKPVIVYCASRRPRPQTNRNVNPPVVPPPKPELFTVSVNTYESDWCRSGTTIRTTTMTATPIMCQYAEIVFRPAVTLILKKLMMQAQSMKKA